MPLAHRRAVGEAAGRQVEFKENKPAREQTERILRRMDVGR